MIIEVELHKAVIAALKENDDLKAIVSGRIWDETPPKNNFPFVYAGDMSVQTSEEDLIFTEIEVIIQAFSAEKSVAQILTISGLIRDALNQELTVNGFTVAEYYHVATHYPNTIEDTKQSVIQFRYKICVPV